MKLAGITISTVVVALSAILFLPMLVLDHDDAAETAAPATAALETVPLSEPVVTDDAVEPVAAADPAVEDEIPPETEVALPTELLAATDPALQQPAEEPAEADAPTFAQAPAEEPAVDPPGLLTKDDIIAATPSRLRAGGFLSEIYSFESAGDISDVQRNAITHEITGKMVEWELTLFNTSEDPEGRFVLMSAGPNEAEVFCKIGETTADEAVALKALQPGDRFTCKGPISGAFIRNIVIEPAVFLTATTL